MPSNVDFDIHFKPTLDTISIFELQTEEKIIEYYQFFEEYYNKAFNILCLIVILTFVANIIFGIYDIVVFNDISALLAILNNLSRATMIFLFTFFAYDSAKKQLNKVDFDK